MTPDHLFASTASGDLPRSSATVKIRTDLLEGLRRAPVDDIDDLDVAEALALLLHSDFMAYGTGGG